jgi:VWFA-related protein
MITSIRGSRLAIAALILLFVSAAPRSSTERPVQAPAARGGAPVVIDFLAVGRDGQPVSDLKPEDVQLRVGGRPRTIQSLRFVAPPVEGGAGPAGAALSPPFGTNVAETGAGRTIFLLVEDGSIRPGADRALKEQIGQFLDALSPRDRVALLTMPLPSVRVDLTTNHQAVRDALPRIAGLLVKAQSQEDAANRTRQTLEALRGLLGSMGDVHGPTTILFFSSGLLASFRPTGQMGSAAGDLSTEHFRTVGVAAAAARALVYVIQADETVTQQSEGLESLAGVTSGGQVLRLVSTGETPLSRIARETSGSYQLAFEPEASERNGQSHRLELRVAREDVAIRARPEIVIAKADPKAGRMSPQDMMKVATVFRDLPLRAAGYASRDVGDKLKVVVIAEPAAPEAKLTAAVAGVYDAKGRLTAQLTAKDELAGSPLMLVLPVPAAGAYRLRVAAADASGRTGTADYDLAAELVTAGPIKLSALLLGAPRGESGFAPALQFRDEKEAIAYFELYGAPTGQLSAKLELAATVDGPPLAQAPLGAAPTSEPDRFQLNGRIPIASLAPGDYVVRAIVQVAGQPEGRIVRTLRKVAK